MTITFKEKMASRSATASFEGGRTYKRVYIAKSTAKDSDEVEVTAAIGIGYGASVGTFDTHAVCTVIDPVQMSESPYYWTVTYTYSSNNKSKSMPEAAQPNGGSPQSPASRPQDPTARLPEWKVSFRKVQEAVTDDLDGNPLMNSAGLPFIPAQTIPKNIAVISVTINLASFTLSSATALLDHVNDDTYYSFPAGTLLISGVEATSQFENNKAFWQVGWTFEYNSDGWNPVQILDQGFSYFDEDADTWVKFRDAFGAEMSEPQLLDGSGGPLAHGDTPVYLDFTMYPTATFTTAIFP